MTLSRRNVLQLAASAGALCAASHIAHSEAYPTRPVHLIVPVAPGGALDILSRILGQWLTEHMGQTFVIENRPGGGTNIGVDVVAHATPDGYTLLLIPQSVTTNATLYKDLNFNFIRDIVPIAMISKLPLVMEITNAIPAKTVPEFIAYVKANPGKVSMASGGSGSASHVGGELFKMMTGIEMVHVPYRGEAQAIVDMMGGQLSIDFSTLGGASEFIKSGKLRALAVTGAQRSPSFPDIRAVSETLPGYDATPWSGLCAPKATPAEIIAKLNRAVNAGLADPKMKAQFALLGSVPTPLTSDQYGQAIVSETQKWGKVIRAAGIKVQ